MGEKNMKTGLKITLWATGVLAVLGVGGYFIGQSIKKTKLGKQFAEDEAKRILQKIEFHYTPKHASWLNVAEIEIGVMDAECTKRRIKDKATLTKEVAAWTARRNRQRKKINWHFTRIKADKKLSKHYVS